MKIKVEFEEGEGSITATYSHGKRTGTVEDGSLCFHCRAYLEVFAWSALMKDVNASREKLNLCPWGGE